MSIENIESYPSLEQIPTIVGRCSAAQAARFWPILFIDVRKLQGHHIRSYRYVLQQTFKHVQGSLAGEVSAEEDRLLSTLSSLIQKQPTATLTFLANAFSHGSTYVISSPHIHSFILTLFIDAILDDKPKLSHQTLNAAIINCKDSCSSIIRVIAGDLQLHKQTILTPRSVEALVNLISQSGGSCLGAQYLPVIKKAAIVIQAKTPSKVQIVLLLILSLVEDISSAWNEVSDVLLQCFDEEFYSLLRETYVFNISATSSSILDNNLSFLPDYFAEKLDTLESNHSKFPWLSLRTFLTVIRDFCSVSPTDAMWSHFTVFLTDAFTLLRRSTSYQSTYTPISGLLLTSLAIIFASSLHRQHKIEVWEEILYKGILADIITDIDSVNLLNASFRTIGPLPANHSKLFLSLAYMRYSIHKNLIRGYSWPSSSHVSVSDFSPCSELLNKILYSFNFNDFRRSTQPLMDRTSLDLFFISICQSIRVDPYVSNILSLSDADRSILASPPGEISKLHTPKLQPPAKPVLNSDDLKREQQYKSELRKYNEELQKVLLAEEARRKDILELLASFEKRLWTYMDGYISIPRRFIGPTLTQFTILASDISRATEGLPLTNASSLVKILVTLLNHGLSACSFTSSSVGCGVDTIVVPCHIYNPALLITSLALLIAAPSDLLNSNLYSFLTAILFSDYILAHWKRQQLLYPHTAFTTSLCRCIPAPDSFQSWALLSSIALYGLSSQFITNAASYFMLGASLPVFHRFLAVTNRTIVSPGTKQQIFEYINVVLQYTPSHLQQSMSRQYYLKFLDQLLILLEYGESTRLGRQILTIFCRNIPRSSIDSKILSPLIENMSHPTQKLNRHMAIDGLMALDVTSRDQDRGTALIDTPHLYCQFLIARSEFLLDSLERFIASNLHPSLLANHSVLILRELLSYCLETHSSDYALGLLPKTLSYFLSKLPHNEQKVVYLAYVLLMNYLVCSYTIIEDSYVDVNTPKAMLRRQLWASMAVVLQTITANNISLLQCHEIVRDLGQSECILAGSLSILPTYLFPMACDITLEHQAAEKVRRMKKLREECLFLHDGPTDFSINPNLVVVPSYFDADVIIDSLRASSYIFVHRDPLHLTCLELVIEFALLVGFLDFDKLSLRSCIDCILTIFYLYETKYRNQLLFIKSSTRKEYLDSVHTPETVYLFFRRILEYGTLLLEHGNFYRHLLHQDMINHQIDMCLFASLLTVLSSICTWLPWPHTLRDEFFSFLTSLLKVKDKTENRILYHSIVQYVAHALPPNSNQAFEYAKSTMLKQFSDLLTTTTESYPGAPFALSGICVYCGLDCLLRGPEVISTYLFPLLEPANRISALTKANNREVHQVLAGLVLLEGLYTGFKQLLEPCLNQILPFLLKLYGTPNESIIHELDRIQRNLLQYLSPFGMQYILPTLLNALNLSSDWNERYGALTLMYSICTIDSRVISHLLLKRIISNMLPKVIPAILEIIILESNVRVKNIAQKTMDVVSLSVQSADLRTHVPKILKAFSDPSLLRDILCDISEINFKTRIDEASLTLLVPLCQKALSVSTPVIYIIGSDRMVNTHTKVIACECLGLFCNISVLSGLKSFSSLIRQSLRTTLIETSPEIRSAGAKALAKLCMAIPNEATAVINDLWTDIFMKKKISYSEIHGLAEAISITLVDMNREAELYSNLRLFYYFRCNWTFSGRAPEVPENLIEHFSQRYKAANAMIFILILQYMIKRIVELHNPPQETAFIDIFFKEAFSMIFISVADNVQDMSYFLEIRSRIARILATSFLNTESYQIEIILQTIQAFAFDTVSATRALCASLTGDIISDLGSQPTSSIVSQLDNEAKKSKLQLNDAYYSLGERSEKTKIFIPDNAIRQAIVRLGKENFKTFMSILFLLRLDPVTEVRVQAMTNWKAIVQKPMEMMRECMPCILRLLLELSNLVNPTEAISQDTFSHAAIIDLTIQDLLRISTSYTSEHLYPILKDLILASDPDTGTITPEVTGALYVFSVLLKHSQVPADLIHTDLIHKISLYLSHPNALVSYSAINLLSGLSVNKDNIMDITSAIINPLFAEIFETDDSVDNQISTLVSLCQKKATTMATVITRVLDLLDEDLLGTSVSNQKITQFISRALSIEYRGFISVAKMMFERLCKSLSSCAETTFEDTVLISELHTLPFGRILEVTVTYLAADKNASAVPIQYCTSHFKSPAIGEIATMFTVMKILLDYDNPSQYYLTILHNSDYLRDLLHAMCSSMDRQALTGSVLTIINALHGLNKALGMSSADFLDAFVYGLHTGLRAALVLNSGFLVVVSQAGVSLLLEVLMCVLSSKFPANEYIQNTAITTSLFLLYAAGSVPSSRRHDSGVREVVLDDVTFFIDGTGNSKSLKPYVTRSVGRILNILNDQLTASVRARLLDELSAILQLSPENCRLFDGSIRITLFTKKGLLSPAKDVRIAAAKTIVLLANISTKPEQIAYLLLSTAITHSPATAQVVISSESVDVNTSVLLCLADLLQTVSLNQAAVLTKIATLPLTKPLLDSIISYTYQCYTFDVINAYKQAAAECIVAAIMQLPLERAIEHVVISVFTESHDSIVYREQNRIAHRLVTAKAISSSQPRANSSTSGIEIFMLAHEVYQKETDNAGSIDSWLTQRLDRSSEAADYLTLLELYTQIFVVAGSFIAEHGTTSSSTLSNQIIGLVAPAISCVENTLKCLVDPTRKVSPENKLSTIDILKRCSTNENLSEAHLKLLTTYIALELKILICDKNHYVTTAADNLFISLFRLQYGMDFANSVFHQLAKRHEGFAKELQAYSEMLVRRLQAHG